jgi:hypothetical protein
MPQVVEAAALGQDGMVSRFATDMAAIREKLLGVIA